MSRMGKYIIDVGEAYVKHICGKGDMLCLPVRINEFEDNWLNTDIPLTPCTDPDMEKIREEAYRQGYDTGYGTKVNEFYEQGLTDAWEAARTLWNTPARKEIFGCTTFNTAITTLTGQEAIEKIRQYEQEQEEIHLGDEVTFLPNNAKGIVSECHVPDVYSDNDKYAVWCGGTMEYVLKQHLTKTGRTFPEIAEILQKMKEES